jgi:hypothetical protein
MEAKRPVRWWRLWVIGSLAWTVLILALGLRHMPWPNVDELRTERVTDYCTVTPFGKDLVLTQMYSEAKVRGLLQDPDAFAALIKEAGKNDGSSVSPELMKMADRRRLTPDEQEERESEQVRKWTPWLQRCVRKMDVDYKALRKHEALVALAPEIKMIVSPVSFSFLMVLILWVCRRLFRTR